MEVVVGRLKHVQCPRDPEGSQLVLVPWYGSVVCQGTSKILYRSKRMVEVVYNVD